MTGCGNANKSILERVTFLERLTPMKGKGTRTLRISSSVHRTSDEHALSAQQERGLMPPVTLTHVFGDAPILRHKHYEAPSAFTPENLLREARRQKGLPAGTVPAICVFDPDGDLVDHLRASDRLSPHHTWACYHTRLDTFMHQDMSYGIIGQVVGA